MAHLLSNSLLPPTRSLILLTATLSMAHLLCHSTTPHPWSFASFSLTATLSMAHPPKKLHHIQSFITCLNPAHRNNVHGPPPYQFKHSQPLTNCIIPAHHKQLNHTQSFILLTLTLSMAHSQSISPPPPLSPGHSSCSPRHCPWLPPPRALARSDSWCCRCLAAHSRWCPRCTPTRAKGTEEQRSSQKARPAKVYPHGQCL